MMAAIRLIGSGACRAAAAFIALYTCRNVRNPVKKSPLKLWSAFIALVARTIAIKRVVQHCKFLLCPCEHRTLRSQRLGHIALTFVPKLPEGNSQSLGAMIVYKDNPTLIKISPQRCRAAYQHRNAIFECLKCAHLHCQVTVGKADNTA